MYAKHTLFCYSNYVTFFAVAIIQKNNITVLQCMHGVGEHSGRYEHLGVFLKDNKLAVHSHDYGE